MIWGYPYFWKHPCCVFNDNLFLCPPLCDNHKIPYKSRKKGGDQCTFNTALKNVLQTIGVGDVDHQRIEPGVPIPKAIQTLKRAVSRTDSTDENDGSSLEVPRNPEIILGTWITWRTSIKIPMDFPHPHFHTVLNPTEKNRLNSLKVQPYPNHLPSMRFNESIHRHIHE